MGNCMKRIKKECFILVVTVNAKHALEFFSRVS